MSPVQGKSPLVLVKEPNGNLDMATCRHSVTQSVQSSLADNAREGVRQYIEKEKKKDTNCLTLYMYELFEKIIKSVNFPALYVLY